MVGDGEGADGYCFFVDGAAGCAAVAVGHGPGIAVHFFGARGLGVVGSGFGLVFAGWVEEGGDYPSIGLWGISMMGLCVDEMVDMLFCDSRTSLKIHCRYPLEASDFQRLRS